MKTFLLAISVLVSTSGFCQTWDNLVESIKQNIVAYPAYEYNDNAVYMAYELREIDIPQIFGFNEPDSVVKYTIILNQVLLKNGRYAMVNKAFDTRGVSNIFIVDDGSVRHLKIFIRSGYLATETYKYDGDKGYSSEVLANGMIDIILSYQCDLAYLKKCFLSLSTLTSPHYSTNEMLAKIPIPLNKSGCDNGICEYVYPDGTHCRFCKFNSYNYCARHF